MTNIERYQNFTPSFVSFRDNNLAAGALAICSIPLNVLLICLLIVQIIGPLDFTRNSTKAINITLASFSGKT